MAVYNFTQLGHSYYDIFPSGKLAVLKWKTNKKLPLFSGDYRVSLLAFDDDDPKIMKIVFYMNINSPIKSSF